MTPAQFAKRLDALADSAEELCEELAVQALDLIRIGFNGEQDPNGYPWAPRVGDSGRTKSGGVYSKSNPILYDTGTLKESFVIAGVNKNGFGIINDTPYAGYHQTGTTKMVARPMVPSKDGGLGEWAKPFQDTAREFIKRKLGVK